MTSRERLQKVLNHEQPDRLCIDFGSAVHTGIGVCAVDKLRKEILGLDDYKVKVCETYRMLGEIDPDLREALGIDVAGVYPPTDYFGIRQRCWKQFIMPADGSEILVPGNFNYTVNNFGDYLMYPQGDTSQKPCAMMPQSSYRWETLNTSLAQSPDSYDVRDNLTDFTEISEEDLAYYKSKVEWLYDNTNAGIFLTIPGLSFGDTRLLSAPWMKDPKGIRDVDSWYNLICTKRELVHQIFEHQCEIGLKNIEKLAAVVGDKVQVAYVSGTDFARNDNLIYSPNVYRSLFLPYHKKINDKIHKLTGWKTFMHSCGNIREILPDIIEAGFDIVNPLDYSFAGMNPSELKDEFGSELVFWGGGIDSKGILLKGSAKDVYQQTRKQIDIYSDGCSYVFNSVGSIVNETPTENIRAVFDAISSYL